MARETLDALLNPSLKVSRPVAACTRCRAAKTRCDFNGKLSACSACERAGKAKECSSANDEFARGKERSYVAALENAVQRLQRKIDDNKVEGLMSRKDSTVKTGHGPALIHRPVSNMRRKEASSVDELVSDFGFLTVNATSRDFLGFSSTMSFVKLLKAVALKQPLPVLDDKTIPPRQDITRLVNHYFEQTYVLLPFISETEFMSSLSRIYQEPPLTNAATPFDMWCFRLVLAISSASICQVRGDENYKTAVYHISIAVEYMEQVIRPGSIAGLQALLLLVQYALVDPEYFDSWYLIGMASRLLVDLGLHCEPAREVRISKFALDLRRRIFYCTYALDRLISMSLGHAFSFTDDSAPNVLLPTLQTDQEAQSPNQLFMRSIRASLFLFDIRRVQSGFFQRTRWSNRQEWNAKTASTYVSSTLDDIQSWHITISASPHFSQLQQYFFYLEFLFSQTLVLSPNQIIPVTSISDAHKQKFFQVAVLYSEHLRNMVANPESQTCLCHADFCRARTVSRQFQTVLWAAFDLLIKNPRPLTSTNQAPAMLDNCNQALQFLNNMSQILAWPGKRWGITALQEIFEQKSAVLLARLKTYQQEGTPVAISPQATMPCHVGQPSTPRSSSYGEQQQNTPHTNNTNLCQHTNPSAYSQENSASQTQGLNYNAYQMPPMGNSRQYSNPAMHRSNLLSASLYGHDTEQANPSLPQGSLPRRSYEFRGGQG